MGRTGELARATLDTTDDIFLLSTLPVLDGSKLSQQIWLQAHRTGADTLRTANTRLWLLADSLLTRENRHRIGTFTDGHFYACQRLTHHRTASQQLVVALRHTATGINQILHRRTHTYQEVTGASQTFTRYRGVTLEQRLMLHHSLIDGKGRTNVLHNGTHVDRNSRRCRHLTLNDGINQLFLTTLRIALLQGHYLYLVFCFAEYLLAFLGQQLNSRHFISLNTNVALSHLSTHHQQFQAYENLVGLLHHQTIVGRDVWLALYGVDDDTLSLSGWWRTKLDKGGETGTTHTHDASRLDTVDNLFGCEFGMIFHQLQLVRAVNSIFPFVTLHINNNYRLAVASSINSSINLEHGTTDTRVDRG